MCQPFLPMSVKTFTLKYPAPTRSTRQLARETAHKRRLRRAKQARWRERHPLCAAWHTHKWNASKNGHALLWTFDEFEQFCWDTGYHILRKDGYVIDRIESSEGYCLSNCQLLTKEENDYKGGLEGHYTSGYAEFKRKEKFA